MTRNPLFNLVVSTFETLRSITWEQSLDFVAHAPQNYEKWWTQLLKEAPQHIVIETCLILFIIWLLFIRKTVDPKKATDSEKLSQKEIEWLLETWEPEPLVPRLSDKDAMLANNELVIDEIRGDEMKIRGVKTPVVFASNFDFLGFSRDIDIKQAAKDALDKYGCGSCGPRGFYGTIDQHLILEDALAQFMGTEEAICYSEGASAVTSAIPAFAKKGDLLIIDEACAEPVMTGANLSRATIRYFRHNDMTDLERILEAVSAEDRRLKRDATQQRRFIVVEGLYKNTGELCPLPAILSLKEKYFYRLILDETLSFGTTGPTGRGITEHFGLKPADIEVLTFTLDTVLASVGGVCVGRREIIDHQRLSGAGYCFSASTAPFLCAAAVAALKKLENGAELLQMLDDNSRILHKQLRDIPQLRLLSSAPSPVMHLVLQADRSFDEERIIVQSIVNECINNGIGVISSKFSISRENKPSIMICANARLNDVKTAKIVNVLSTAVKKCYR